MNLRLELFYFVIALPESVVALPLTLGLCDRCGIRIPSALNRRQAFDKDKY